MPVRRIDQEDFILSMLASDDEQAVKILFDQYREFLFDIVSQYINNTADADDLIQELFISIWTKRHTLQITKPLDRYLAKSVLNRVRNFKRDNRRSKEIVITDFDTLENSLLEVPADSALTAGDINFLWEKAKAKMPDHVRITFMLNRKWKMSYSEIAAYLGISKKTVEKNISQALQILREIFKTYFSIVVLAALFQ